MVSLDIFPSGKWGLQPAGPSPFLPSLFVDTPGGVSVMTAEAHRANLMHKMNLHTVSGLIRYAIRHKVVEA